MLQKILNWFLGKKNLSGYASHIKFRSAIKALAMEDYKGVTVLYLSKPAVKKENCLECKKLPEGEVASGHNHTKEEQPIYHTYYKKEFYYGEADTLEELEALAHKDIDNKFKFNK